jgi:hypothetical protein
VIYDTILEEGDELAIVVPGGLLRVRAGSDRLVIEIQREDEARMGPVEVRVP